MAVPRGGLQFVVEVSVLLLLASLCARAQSTPPSAPPTAPSVITVNKVEDIYAALPPPGAKSWDSAPLVAGINASTFAFTPKHYYQVLDHGCPPEVVKTVAAKAAVFYDPKAVPMSVIAANARAGQPPATIPVPAAEFVLLFEFFNDAQNDILLAEQQIPGSPDQAPGETLNAYERRMRTREEALVRARGPIEGRIAATTFVVDLPASVTERDGCKRSVATADGTAIPIELFRTGMGTRNTTASVEIRGSSTIEAAEFTIASPRRFEVVGRCGTTATKVKLTMNRSADGKWTGQGGF